MVEWGKCNRYSSEWLK